MSLETPKQDISSIKMEELPKIVKNTESENPSVCENLINYLREWTSRSGLHGSYYILEPNRSLCERIYWIFIIALCAFACFNAIVELTWIFSDTPYISIIIDGPIDISEIPFPAVTICPEIKSRQRTYNLTEYYMKIENDPESLNLEDLKMFEKISLVCKDDYIEKGTEYLQNLSFLEEIAPKTEDVFEKCVWNRKNMSCNYLFSPTLTDEGVCFTFNMNSLEDIFSNDMEHDEMFETPDKQRNSWSLRDGYLTFEEEDTFPFRAISGINSGLTLYLRTDPRDMDQVCKKETQGFKIQLNNPAEYPYFEREYFKAPLSKEILIGVEPNMLRSEDTFYFPDLMFYRHYTEDQCEMECIAEQLKSQCNCVEYYMPRDDETDICGIGKRNCTKYANTSDRCMCSIYLYSLTYTGEISQYDFQKTNNDGDFLTKVSIYFKQRNFMAFERTRGQSTLEQIGIIGGTVSFFLGISVLYIAEIFYFITLRCLCNIKRLGNQFWSGLSMEDIDQ